MIKSELIITGNFICVFKCTIVNLATYRQFTNAAWDWIIYKKKKQTKKTKTKTKARKKYQNCIKSGLCHNNNNNTDAVTLGGSPFTATSVHKREKQTLNVQTFNIF